MSLLSHLNSGKSNHKATIYIESGSFGSLIFVFLFKEQFQAVYLPQEDRLFALSAARLAPRRGMPLQSGLKIQVVSLPNLRNLRNHYLCTQISQQHVKIAYTEIRSHQATL
jgi:hypothetical protein